MNEVYEFLSDKSDPSMEMLIDSSVYFVATHYKLSIPQVLAMTPEDFEQSLVWASAMKRIESEEMDKMNSDMKNGTDIASTKRKGEPFPFE